MTGKSIRKRCYVQTLERCNLKNLGRMCISIQYNFRNITKKSLIFAGNCLIKVVYDNCSLAHWLIFIVNLPKKFLLYYFTEKKNQPCWFVGIKILSTENLPNSPSKVKLARVESQSRIRMWCIDNEGRSFQKLQLVSLVNR